MEKSIINVEGMMCEHCVKAVTGAVSPLDGVAKVDVDLAAKTVTVEYDKISLEKIKEAIEEQGYEVAGSL
ncbi:copper chaperone CopZ [Clostridia bacterium]|nr:copper chaperone CopZ [Clostridia bacterium]